MDALYDTLARRMRPEDVAEVILSSLGTRLNGSERAMLERAAEGSLVRRYFGFTSMSQDWGRAVGPQGAMEVAADLFASAPVVRPGDADVPERVDAFLDVVELEIRKIVQLGRLGRRRLPSAGKARSRTATPIEHSGGAPRPQRFSGRPIEP